MNSSLSQTSKPNFGAILRRQNRNNQTAAQQAGPIRAMPMAALQESSEKKESAAPARDRRPRASRGALPTENSRLDSTEAHDCAALQAPATPSHPQLSTQSQWRRTSTRIFGAVAPNQQRSSLINPEEPRELKEPSGSSVRMHSSRRKPTQ